ncbi:MAG: host attachment protein [Mariprofundaceae bacterium]
MQRIWILTADNAEAVIYSSNGGRSDLIEHKRFTHPQSRLHDRDLTSDLPGRTYDSAGHGRHAMEQPLDPKKHEAATFAKQLADYLHHACSDGSCNKLYIAASPAFLGLLREHYSKPVQQVLAQELDCNLVAQPADSVRSHFPEYL